MRKQEMVDYITARLKTLNSTLGIELLLPFEPKDIRVEHIKECYTWLKGIMTSSYKEYNLVYRLHAPEEWAEIQNHLALFEEEKILKNRKHKLRCDVNNRQQRPYVLRKQYVRDKETEERRKATKSKSKSKPDAETGQSGEDC